MYIFNLYVYKIYWTFFNNEENLIYTMLLLQTPRQKWSNALWSLFQIWLFLFWSFVVSLNSVSWPIHIDWNSKGKNNVIDNFYFGLISSHFDYALRQCFYYSYKNLFLCLKTMKACCVSRSLYKVKI